MNKKASAYRRGLAIGRTCLLLFLVLLIVKVTGVTVNLRLGSWSLHYDFAGLPWCWVIAPVAVPAGILLATALTVITLFYPTDTKHGHEIRNRK